MSTFSVMSMLRNSNASSRMWAMFSNDPVSRLSMQITRCPSPSSRSQRWDPRKPAPPVTTQVLIGRSYRHRGAPDVPRNHSAISDLRAWTIRPDGGRDVPRSYLALPVSERQIRSSRGTYSVKTVDAQGAGSRLQPGDDAARNRAAVEIFSRNEAPLRRIARRFSICDDDADEALQRGLEILLRKAPTGDPRELTKWVQTVVRHEALAVRRERERTLAGPAAGAGRAPRGSGPQPRGAAGAEAAGAAGADAAGPGLLLRRDRRDHRLQPDESQVAVITSGVLGLLGGHEVDQRRAVVGDLGVGPQARRHQRRSRRPFGEHEVQPRAAALGAADEDRREPLLERRVGLGHRAGAHDILADRLADSGPPVEHRVGVV